METKDLIKHVRRLEIKTKGLTRHIFSGEYHSAFKGRGMAFSEVRDYQIGDEVRTIDWNVTARFNSPFVKIFEEERELTVMLIIDVSGSSDFGSEQKTKRDLAVEIAAVLAFSAVSNNDKVGAIFVSDRMEKYIAPDKGRKHALIILRELIEFQSASKGTNLSEGLRYFRNTQKKRSICFVISDLIDDNYLEGFQVSRKKHDMVAIILEDPAEYRLPDLGYLQLFNAETGETNWVNTSDEKVREKMEKDHHQHIEQIGKSLLRTGVDFEIIRTDQDFILPLLHLFKRR